MSKLLCSAIDSSLHITLFCINIKLAILLICKFGQMVSSLYKLSKLEPIFLLDPATAVEGYSFQNWESFLFKKLIKMGVGVNFKIRNLISLVILEFETCYQLIKLILTAFYSELCQILLDLLLRDELLMGESQNGVQIKLLGCTHLSHDVDGNQSCKLDCKVTFLSVLCYRENVLDHVVVDLGDLLLIHGHNALNYVISNSTDFSFLKLF